MVTTDDAYPGDDAYPEGNAYPDLTPAHKPRTNRRRLFLVAGLAATAVMALPMIGFLRTGVP